VSPSPSDPAARYWANDHPVLELLRRRRDDGSRPGARTDGQTLALAVAGGGMRGIVSAAMLTALEDLGFARAFDAVYGCSSGAINSAYFLVGEGWYPLSIYYDDLTTKRFLDFRRALIGRAMLDLSYAFDVVVESLKPLDYATVLASPVRLNVAISLVDELKAIAPSNFTSKEELKSALKASGWLPIATKGTATFRNQRALDGGVLVAHPFRFAVSNGCTHILSLSTRPMQPSSRRRISAAQWYAVRHLERIRRGLGTAYLSAVRTYAHDLVELHAARTRPMQAPWILDLAPLPGTPDVKRHEMDVGRLIQGARSAYELVYLAIERRQVRAIPRLTIPPPLHMEPEVR
jgi:predicted patatin/cPLA2 family phospholipase